MLDTIQGRLLSALLVALKPLVRALMNSGMGYREFAEITKTAFVQIAAEEYGIRGRPTNSSRIAVITGISRKEVARIRNSNFLEVTDFVQEPPASSVLHAWTTNPTYLDNVGNPIPLPFTGREVSFAVLVAKFAGDIPPGAIRTELMRVGAIREDKDKRLCLVKRHYVPMRIDDRLQHGLESAIWSLADTIAFNCDPNLSVAPRFQRVVSADGINPALFPEIQKESSCRLEKFTEDYDDYLSHLEMLHKNNSINSQVGIGLYYYQFQKKASKEIS